MVDEEYNREMAEDSELEGIVGILLMTIYVFASVYIPMLNVPFTQIKLVHQTGIALVLGFLAGMLLKEVRGN